MPVLHTVNTLSDGFTAIRDCVGALENDDAVVFMEDAAGEDMDISTLPVYPDLIASGCSLYLLPLEERIAPERKLPDTVKQINYDDFVGLCCRFPVIQNWY